MCRGFRFDTPTWIIPCPDGVSFCALEEFNAPRSERSLVLIVSHRSGEHENDKCASYSTPLYQAYVYQPMHVGREPYCVVIFQTYYGEILMI
jgi:hypothetical protein